MLQTLLTLVMLASGPSGNANQLPANHGLYELELAFQQAQVEAVDEASALPLEMAQADQRVAEAEAAAQQGDQAAADKALGHYDHTLTMLTEDAMSADGIDTDALMDEIDAKLADHSKKIKGIKGQDKGDDQGEEGGGDKSVCTRTDHPVAEKIAAQYGVTTEQVMGWFCGDDKMGFGKIMLVLRMSQESGKSVDEILAMHASGASWGQIKHELGVVGKGHVKHNNGKGHGNGNGNGGKNGNGHANGGGNGNKNGNGHANGGKNGGGDDDGDDTGGDTGGDDGNTGISTDGGDTGGDDNQNVNENENANSNDNGTNTNENLNTNSNDNSTSTNTNGNLNDNTTTP